MASKNLEILVQQYLRGELKGKDLIQFQSQLADDEALQEEVLLQIAIKNNFEQEQKGRFKKLASQYNLKPVRSGIQLLGFRLSYQKLAITGLLLIVLLTILFLFYPTSDESDFNQILAEQSKEIYPLSPTGRFGNTPDEIQEDWYSLYEEKQFNELILILEQTRNTNTESAYQNFTLALGYFYANEFSKAITVFESGLTAQPQPYLAQMRWFLALSYLNLNERQKGQELLQLIEKDKTWKHKKANQLLNNLNETQ